MRWPNRTDGVQNRTYCTWFHVAVFHSIVHNANVAPLRSLWRQPFTNLSSQYKRIRSLVRVSSRQLTSSSVRDSTVRDSIAASWSSPQLSAGLSSPFTLHRLSSVLHPSSTCDLEPLPFVYHGSLVIVLAEGKLVCR